jgi:hypothetical protein
VVLVATSCILFPDIVDFFYCSSLSIFHLTHPIIRLLQIWGFVGFSILSFKSLHTPLGRQWYNQQPTLHMRWKIIKIFIVNWHRKRGCQHIYDVPWETIINTVTWEIAQNSILEWKLNNMLSRSITEARHQNFYVENQNLKVILAFQ